MRTDLKRFHPGHAYTRTLLFVSLMKSLIMLRTFARKFSNIDSFLKILPLKGDELVMSER